MSTQVTIYGAEWCAFCHQAKQYLDGLKVPYIYFDIDRDPTKGQEVIEKSGQTGIPVIQIGKEIIIGFDRPNIDSALRAAGLKN